MKRKKTQYFGAGVCALLVLCSAFVAITVERAIATTFGTEPLTTDPHGPYEGPIDEPIQFFGSATGGEEPYSFYWDFGDDVGTSTEQNPLYMYHIVGDFTVTLTVADSAGNTSTNKTMAIITNWHLRVNIHTQGDERNYTEGDKINFECYVENNPADVSTPPCKYRIWLEGTNVQRAKVYVTLKSETLPCISPRMRYTIDLCWDADEFMQYFVYIEATAGNVTKLDEFWFNVKIPGREKPDNPNNNTVSEDEHGAEGKWSTLPVGIPENKVSTCHSLFQSFLKNHPRMFPLLRGLLRR